MQEVRVLVEVPRPPVTPKPPTPKPPAPKPPTPKPPALPTGTGGGYWLLERDGDIAAYGAAAAYETAKPNLAAGASAVALAARPDGKGLWVLTSDGDVIARGEATDFGRVDLAQLTKPGERVATMSATPTGKGLWVFTTAGRILSFGDALPADEMTGSAEILALDLDGPIIHSAATPTGKGAYLVASDGGVFTIGDARFIDSVRGQLSKLFGPPGMPDLPVVGITPDPDGDGYWMVAADGGVFSFRTPFRGSLPAVVPFDRLAAPVNGMVPYGNGYLLVAGDGGVFTFSNKPFQGSGAGNLDSPVVAIASA
jgi:ribosomal protein L24E